ncbi:MAG TPA: CARDB domain-containing protein [Fimbriimonadaceae bacterium]|nr:CARDB domain-containing protein [Fimbriimonadaceae bacterium]
MLLTCLAAAAFTQTASLELYRGAPLGPQSIRYWSAEDTVLDASKPDANMGGDSGLLAGPGKTLLIRFGDLARAVGPGRRIRSATLVLTYVSPSTPQLRSVRRVLAPWGEGPARTISYFGSNQERDAAAVRWSATWRHRRGGADPIPWQRPGAMGEGDAQPIPTARSSVEEDRIVIEGLGEAVQKMSERWYENHGFALLFDNTVEVESSQSQRGRPRLLLELEDAPPTSGPDLSVTLIARSPEYPKMGEKQWPADGEEVTYTAHIKNVGNAEAEAFAARWVVRERPGSAFPVSVRLKPGESTTVTLKKAFQNDHLDHRRQQLMLLVEPGGPDANPSNNALEIHENALAIGIALPKFAWEHPGPALEDWAQEQVRLLNDVIMAHSRFSFAPHGSLERVRIQALSEATEGVSAALDATWQPGFGNNMALDRQMESLRQNGLRWLLFDIAGQFGLFPLGAVQVRPSDKPEATFTRGMLDRFPGILGGGDTRNDSLMPPQLPLPYAPAADPVVVGLPLEPTDLLAATDVVGFNTRLGRRNAPPADYMQSLPLNVAVRVLDSDGNPLARAKVEFLPVAPNGLPDVELMIGQPLYVRESDDKGTILLPKVPGGSVPDNPFGDFPQTGGILLARTTIHGTTEYAWLKVWHLADAYHRGQKGVAILDLRFNVPSAPIEGSTNLAADRIVSDAGGSAAPTLQALVDGDPATAAEVTGGWLEIDLGRDRPIGEIRLYPSGEFWNEFDIHVYATGEEPGDAKLWARELDFGWSKVNRVDREAGAASVAYRGRAVRVRFIRLIAKGSSPTKTSLAEVKVAPIRFSEGG